MNDAIASPTSSGSLSISIVVYRPNHAVLEQTLRSLAAACERLRSSRPRMLIDLFMVDNGGLEAMSTVRDKLESLGVAYRVLTGHGNVGYGRGHNLAIDLSTSRHHLILNPDIDLDTAALAAAFDFFEANPQTGLLTPWIGDDVGAQQYLCRRYPSAIDLFVRGFLPVSLRSFFSRRLAHYEMRDVINDRDVVWDPPIVSGCFMLFCTEVLKKLGGFDPRYFLYFEDYDLSLRTHDVARVAYVPAVRVIHHGGGASRKGFAHIRMFAASAFKFYNRFGWRLW
ncbi:glycosyltransferase [Burkholderia multivorans]|uniref:Glycosyl transferase, family 2 n=1 Tax=Burkholderia multivorans CGD2 TaxID=513052 RepID=B9BSW9_9BURK|nr:glycosyltransferase [Burkholderia multivorans]EEE06189.1 glycosyl transferase, family 2 [Burkholderia multivorans CGD2]EEE11359.1 glycosyl transferase, family 2 [Burkholderia multivorans CGD2M]MBU9368010.1 glycosyltransferase [Burkholderia multivorans]MCO1419776.1 glycosyltransferase [Burkholderia multivorans]PRD91827.1 glycosyl transferase [Burkholderia multivorans]